MAAFTRRQYAGAAAATTITAGINNTDTTCTLAATTGWPATAAVPFYVVIDPGTSSEEKVSATISGSTLTITRAQDDTTASSHSSGATIYPVFTANDADEANEVVSKLTTKGDLLATDGSALNRLAVGTNAHVLTADSAATNGVKWALSPETDLVTTKGDILVATAADTLARLPVGINGYRVTAASGETSGLKYDMPSIPVFDDAAARDAAFGGSGEKTLAEGQFAFLKDSNSTQFYDGAVWQAVAGGKVAQVVSTAKLSTFTTTSATYVDVTGLTATITPSSASSKVLIIAQVTTGYGTDSGGHFRLNGGNASTYVGTASSSRVSGVYGAYTGSTFALMTIANSMIYLDSPATTSATTYAVQARRGAAGTARVNNSSQDTDDANSIRGASSITVMEILA